MPLGMEVNLGPGDVVSDGVAAPQFSVHIYCGQTAGWIKTPLGAEMELGPGHIVRRGPSSPSLFDPCLLWPLSTISATAELLSRYFTSDVFFHSTNGKN